MAFSLRSQSFSLNSLQATSPVSSPIVLNSPKFIQSQCDSNAASNIKKLCLDILLSHADQCDTSKTKTTKTKLAQLPKGSQKSKSYRSIVNNSVKLQHSIESIIKSKQISSRYQTRTISPTVQKKLFQHILTDPKQQIIKHKTTQKTKENVTQLKTKFLNKISKLSYYQKYLNKKDIDLLFSQCINIPESRWQLLTLDFIQSKRNKTSV